VLADLPPSVLREDLVRRVAGKLELTESRVASLVANGRAPAASGVARDSSAGRVPTIDHSVRAERTFLVLCVAMPEAGNTALAAIDPEQHLTSAVLRRTARHLAGQTELPMTDLPTDDEELAHVVADLVARAGRAPGPSVDRLEHARLVLELARLDRAIRRARGERVGDVGDLARERERVLAEIRKVTARLEQTV
jgi:hypothetical protein